MNTLIQSNSLNTARSLDALTCYVTNYNSSHNGAEFKKPQKMLLKIETGVDGKKYLSAVANKDLSVMDSLKRFFQMQAYRLESVVEIVKNEQLIQQLHNLETKEMYSNALSLLNKKITKHNNKFLCTLNIIKKIEKFTGKSLDISYAYNRKTNTHEEISSSISRKSVGKQEVEAHHKSGQSSNARKEDSEFLLQIQSRLNDIHDFLMISSNGHMISENEADFIVDSQRKNLALIVEELSGYEFERYSVRLQELEKHIQRINSILADIEGDTQTLSITQYGIENRLGYNLCYINSTIQALTHSPSFLKHARNVRSSRLLDHFFSIYENLRKMCVSCDQMQNFRVELIKNGWQVDYFSQEDISEFLMFLLNHFEYPNFRYTTLEEDQTITQKPLQTKLLCIHISESSEGSSIQNLIDENIVIENENSIERRSKQETLLYANDKGLPPQFFPIQLIRFNQDMTKNTKRIAPSERIEISVLLPNPSSKGEYHTKTALYKLTSVSVHQGKAGPGHYVSYVLSEKAGWIECNDSYVKQRNIIRIEDDIAKNGYIYYYEFLGYEDD